MFYCEECKVANKYPGIIPVSYGRCEVCGRVRECYDRRIAYTPVETEYTPKHRKDNR